VENPSISYIYDDPDGQGWSNGTTNVGWVGLGAPRIRFGATDPGLGVKRVQLINQREGQSPRSTDYTIACGNRNAPCPSSATSELTYQPGEMPEGQNTLDMTFFDAADNLTTAHWTVSVDRTWPSVDVPETWQDGDAGWWKPGSTAGLKFTPHDPLSGAKGCTFDRP
jgi:hypothetical protein